MHCAMVDLCYFMQMTSVCTFYVLSFVIMGFINIHVYNYVLFLENVVH